MTEMSYPPAKDLPTKAFARAANAGILLARGADGELGTTRDFALALPCGSREQAAELWRALCEQTIQASGAKPAPKWCLADPVVMEGLEHAKPPDSLRAFLAVCQGRFVSQFETPGGSSYRLTPNMAEARIFTREADALSALRMAMPAGDKKPLASALPLMAYFGAPTQASEHGGDALAASMAAASARALISPSGASDDQNPSAGRVRRSL